MPYHSLQRAEAHLLPLLQDEHHELHAFSLHKELPASCPDISPPPPKIPHGRQSEYSCPLTDMTHKVTPSHIGTNL